MLWKDLKLKVESIDAFHKTSCVSKHRTADEVILSVEETQRQNEITFVIVSCG